MALPRAAGIGLGVSVALALIFVVWSTLALRDGALAAFDHDVAFHFYQQVLPGQHLGRDIMVAFTNVGSVPSMTCLALAGLLWQCWRRDSIRAIGWIAVVISGGLLNVGMKMVFDRDRPPAEWRDAAVHETNESFPSGHAMGAMIGYGMLGYAMLSVLRRRVAQLAWLASIAAIIGLIGFSRIYLRAHWFSDVVGGFLAGGSWLAFGLASMAYWQANVPSTKPHSER